MKAYVLIQTEAGSQPIAPKLRAIGGVVSAEDTSGAYDAIALASSGSTRHLIGVILEEIRNLPGVTRALPAPVIKSLSEDRRSEAFEVHLGSRDNAA